MAITNFTRGPWAVFDTHPSKACFYIDRHDVAGEHAVGEVAVIYTTTDQTKRANAHLIACAPELYTVLDAFLSDYEERGEVDYKLRERAQAVLDKAVGR